MPKVRNQGSGGLGISDYVIEATSKLSAPVERWLMRQNFYYDLAYQVWRFQGVCPKGPKILAEAREWVEKICGWLQYKYPDGPEWSESLAGKAWENRPRPQTRRRPWFPQELVKRSSGPFLEN